VEGLAIGLGVVLGIAFVVAPFVALAFAVGARKRIAKLEIEGEARKTELRYLYEMLEAQRDRTAPIAPAGAPPQPADATSEPAVAAAKSDAPRDTETTQKTTPVTEELTASARSGERTGQAATTEIPAARPAASEATATTQRADGGAGRREPPKPAAPPSPPKPAIPIEQRIATYFTRIGAGALLLGVLYFFKYAVDNEWIGKMGRVLIGVVAGVGFLAGAEIVRARTRPAYVQVLVGVGLACLYIATYASAALYQLIDVTLAFGASTIILLLGAALAWRHRGEAILILVLIAGFLNPVLLSTGQDRPLGLFSYLLLLTTITLFVSTKKRFQITLPLSIVGVAILFVGWYAKFFETFDHRGETWRGDLPPEQLVGAYHAFAPRIVPLAFVAIFCAQWLGVAFVLRRESALPKWIKPVAIAAMLLSHGGASALLYDRPPVLGAAMIALGLTAVFAMRALEATRFLMLPMLLAFLILAGLGAGTKQPEQLLVVALLGAWSGIYVAAFLKEASDRHRELSKADGIRAGIAILAFAAISAITLLSKDRFYAVSLVMTAASVALVIVSSRARILGMTLAGLLLTFVPLAVAAEQTSPSTNYVDYAYLGLAACWSLVFAAAALHEILKRKATGPNRLGSTGGTALPDRDPRSGWLPMIVMSLSGLLFLALALIGTSEEAPTLRALLTAACGARELAFATAIARSRSDARRYVTLLSAESLALFAPALAFGLSGATITVVWAILALIALFILADSKEPAWLVASALLVAVTLIRVFAFDVDGVVEQIAQFERTNGRSGALSVPTFFNPRAYALLGSGAALLAGAFVVARATKPPAIASQLLRAVAPVLAAIGYALLTFLAVTEVHNAIQELPPPPPMPLDSEEFQVFMQTVHQARAVQHNLFAMSTTVTLALTAMLLLSIGFAAKDAFHRYLGLAVFLGTVGKLVVWDVWNLPRIHQVVVLSVVGALLLGSGFLYARLKALFKGDIAAASALIVLALLPSSARAEDPKPPELKTPLYKSMSKLSGVDTPGDHALTVSLDLYRKSLAEALLDDVRIAGPDGGEVPYVIEDVAAKAKPHIVSGRIYDPGETAQGGFRALFELPDSREHCQVELSLDNPRAFMHRTRIETGDSPKDMQLVVDGALVYALSAERTRAENRVVRYPRSLARFVRVTLLPDSTSGKTRIEGAQFWCADPTTIAPTDRLPLQVTGTTQNAEQKTTEVELDAGDEGVPIDRIEIHTEAQEFVRRIEVLASSYKSAWPNAGAGVIFRIAGKQGGEETTIGLQPTRKRHFKLIIHNGDDAPIVIKSAEGLSKVRRILFRAREGGAHVLYTGDKTGSHPYYDLASILARRADLDPARADLGPFTDNPTFGKEHVSAALPKTERYRREIGIGLAGVLILLGLWAVRLMRGTKEKS
jgi:hypothetical protein